MGNVTYLLGAGASFEILPLIKEVFNDDPNLTRPGMADDIVAMAGKFKRLADIRQQEPGGYLKVLIEEMEKLGRNSKFFSSPDTYIRSLYLQKKDKTEIERLKLLLSFYISQKQFSHPTGIDKRYIPFLASILESKKGGVKIPDNINIVTWNYDFQLELGLQHFSSELDQLDQIQDQFGIVPSRTKNDKPKIVHLNGVAGFYKSGEELGFYPSIKGVYRDDHERLDAAVRSYQSLCEVAKIDDNLSFAWELEDESHERIKQSANFFTQSDIIVVIGYSFPFFNRKVDEALFSQLWGRGNLKIYIQDPKINQSQIKFFRERFRLKDEIEIIPLDSVEQFFLPPEL